MVQELEREAQRQAELALRRQKCTRVQTRRLDQAAEHVLPGHEALQSIQELPAPRRPGAPAPGCGGGVSPCAAAGLESLPQTAKMRVLRLSASPSIAWASGTHFWKKWELQQLRIAQTRITRRIATWFPSGTQMWPEFARHIATWARELRRTAGIPSWDKAVTTTWWRWDAPVQATADTHADSDWIETIAAERSGRPWSPFVRVVRRRRRRTEPLPKHRHYVGRWPDEEAHADAGREEFI